MQSIIWQGGHYGLYLHFACSQHAHVGLLLSSFKVLIMQKRMDRYTRLGTTLYIMLWGLAFLLPFIMQCYEVMSGYSPGFNTTKIARGMLLATAFLVLFLVNNFVLLPKLFVRRRKPLYFVAVIALLALIWFAVPNPHHPHPPGIEFRLSLIHI